MNTTKIIRLPIPVDPPTEKLDPVTEVERKEQFSRDKKAWEEQLEREHNWEEKMNLACEVEKQPSHLDSITGLLLALIYLFMLVAGVYLFYEMAIGDDREQRVINRQERTIDSLKVEVQQLKAQIKKLDDPATRHAR